MAVTLPDNPNKQNKVQLGKDFFLKINTGTAEVPVWTLVGAQRSTSLKRTADEIDTSHKTSGGWKSVKAGLRQWSMEADALVILEDTGAEALEKAYLEGKEVNVQFVYSDNKTTYEGWASITDFSMETPHDDVASISVTLSGNGALQKKTG